MNIGFIGFGNMAQALAEGWINHASMDANRFYASASNYQKLVSNTQRLNMNACQTNEDLIKRCDYIVIAVKPYLVKEVLQPYCSLLQNKVIILVAAGLSFNDYTAFLGSEAMHISTIPNTPVSVAKGVIVVENKHNLKEEDYDKVMMLLGSIALVEVVDTTQLSIAGTIAGCGPAFTSLFIEALGDAGVYHGLARNQAYRLASQMILGTATLQLKSNKHPGIMKDEVCSPKGSTIKGVRSLEKNGFRSSVIEAISAIEKD